jgi:hypothetical protein
MEADPNKETCKYLPSREDRMGMCHKAYFDVYYHSQMILILELQMSHSQNPTNKIMNVTTVQQFHI